MTRRRLALRLMGRPVGAGITGNRQTVFNSQHHCGEQPRGYLITREKQTFLSVAISRRDSGLMTTVSPARMVRLGVAHFRQKTARLSGF
jgi:hypothetical protein